MIHDDIRKIIEEGSTVKDGKVIVSKEAAEKVDKMLSKTMFKGEKFRKIFEEE